MSYMPGQIVRAHNGQSLSEDQLRSAVPALFAEHKHESRSERYTYIPSLTIVAGLLNAGYNVVEARQGRSRIPGKQSYTKHMLRFRHSSLDLRVGDTTAEVVLLNAHDGTRCYKLMSGLFKLICLNGMVLPAGPYSEISVYHTGNILQKVIDGTAVVLENATQLLEKPKQWIQIDLNDGQRNAFAEAARVARFADAEGHVDTPVTAQQLLSYRRPQDAGRDLWSTFNVVQENVIKGGIYNQTRQPNGRLRRSTTREVRGIDQDIRLNRALWTLAEKLADNVTAS